MKQAIKKSIALKGLVALCLSLILLSGCGSNSANTETTADTSNTMAPADTGSSMMMAPADTSMKADSMPPVDTTIEKKPDGRKTK